MSPTDVSRSTAMANQRRQPLRRTTPTSSLVWLAGGWPNKCRQSSSSYLNFEKCLWECEMRRRRPLEKRRCQPPLARTTTHGAETQRLARYTCSSLASCRSAGREQAQIGSPPFFKLGSSSNEIVVEVRRLNNSRVSQRASDLYGLAAHVQIDR